MPKITQQTSDFQTSSSIISKSPEDQVRIISLLYRQETEAQRSQMNFTISQSYSRAKAGSGLYIPEQTQGSDLNVRPTLQCRLALLSYPLPCYPFPNSHLSSSTVVFHLKPLHQGLPRLLWEPLDLSPSPFVFSCLHLMACRNFPTRD